MRTRILAALFLFATLALTPGAKSANDVSKETREETFRVVWETVRDRYFDTTFGGLDWDAVGREYRTKAIGAPSDEAFYDALQAMVDRLGQSHFQVLPPYWVGTRHLARKGSADAGLELVDSGGQMLVWRMREPATHPISLHPGCAILEAAGTNIHELRQTMLSQADKRAEAERLFHEAVDALLAGRPGQSVELRVRCGAAPESKVSIPLQVSQRERSERIGFMPSMETDFEVQRLPGNIVSIRFNLFVMSLLPRIRAAIQQAAVDGARGIIFDVRGNPGGIGAMASGLAGYLVKEQANLGAMKMRGAELKFLAFPQDGAFTGPVAVLIDRNSASTSEIFAAGLQEMGRAVIVGDRSMGAALPSFIVDLPAGALLQFAVADFATPKGFRIEGKGVTPDIRVSLSEQTLLAGEDAPLEAARAALAAKSPGGDDPRLGGIIVTGN